MKELQIELNAVSHAASKISGIHESVSKEIGYVKGYLIALCSGKRRLQDTANNRLKMLSIIKSYRKYSLLEISKLTVNL
jgi:hypothetical protein